MTKNDNLQDIRRPNLRGLPHNKTTLFMLASIGLESDKVPYKLLEYFGLVNCYLSHRESLENYPDSIIMIFNPTNEAIQKFKDFYEIYKTYLNYVDDYLIDFNLIAIVFKVKDKWISSLEAFKRSKYSEMSKEYAELIKKSVKLEVPTFYYVMTKNRDYKRKLEETLSNEVGDSRSLVTIDDDAELMDRLDPEKENFSYEYRE